MIAYVDESAFSFFPSQCRTYSPKGITPVLEHGDLRGGVQVISMATPSGGLYYKMKQGAFKAEDVVSFLEGALHRYRRWKLIVIWDGATVHRGEKVRAFLRERAKGRVHLEMLPAYSPELNVDEQVHGYVKKNLLANRVFKRVEELEQAVAEGYLFLKQNPWLVHNFFFNENTGFYPL